MKSQLQALLNYAKAFAGLRTTAADLEIDRLLRSWWSGLDESALPSKKTIYLITRFVRFLLMQRRSKLLLSMTHLTELSHDPFAHDSPGG